MLTVRSVKMTWGTMVLLGTAPVVIWSASVLLAATFPEYFKAAAVEDGAIENGQAMLLLANAALSAKVAIILHRSNIVLWNLLYFCLTFGFVIIAGEEISWGQRMFSFDTPNWLDDNVQGEANLHNLPGITQTLHDIIYYSIFALTALSIATIYWESPKFIQRHAHLWLPHPILAPAWLCFLSYSWIRAIDRWWYGLDYGHPIVSRLQEAAELILYMGICIFLFMVLGQIHRRATAEPPSHARSLSRT